MSRPPTCTTLNQPGNSIPAMSTNEIDELLAPWADLDDIVFAPASLAAARTIHAGALCGRCAAHTLMVSWATTVTLTGPNSYTGGTSIGTGDTLNIGDGHTSGASTTLTLLAGIS